MVPMIYKLISKNRDAYHRLIAHPGHNIYPNNFEDTTYNRLCSKQMDSTAKRCVKKLFLLNVGGWGTLWTIHTSLVTDNRTTTTTAIKFPFVDEESIAEFQLNLILQFICLVYGTFLNLGIEISMSLFENFVTISPKLIQNEVSEVIDSHKRSQLLGPQFRIAFKNSVVRSLEFNR